MPTGGRVIQKVAELSDWNQAAINDGQFIKYDAASGKYIGSSAGGGDLTYVHDQAAPASQWTITHNLGKYPSVNVVDSAGTAIEGEVQYTSINQLVVSFYAGGALAATAGFAYLN